MKIELSFSGAHLDELHLREKNVVVIDVLRSSTTIVTALANGAREVIPVASVENAVKISGSLFGDVTLRGGERQGKIIDGFNLGNSPLEYSQGTVQGKSIIYCTTNGTVAIVKAKYARNLVIGAFVNLSKVVEFIRELDQDVMIICAGNQLAFGNFSLEDTVCGGMIIDEVIRMKGHDIEFTDGSTAAHMLYKKHSKSLGKMIRSSSHGQYLKELGFSEDLELSARIDAFPVLPIYFGNAIKIKKDE